MIDLHFHILAGIDDGAHSVEESVGLAREAAAAGVRAIAATPHVSAGYPTTADHMEAGVAELRQRLEQLDVPIRILTGGEIAIDRLEQIAPEELRRFGLGGNPGYLLLEAPDLSWPHESDRTLIALARDGVTPVLAHPERNEDVQRDLECVARLVRGGALVQLTAASLAGQAGPAARETAVALLETGSAHLVASDSHGPHVRRAGLEAVSDLLGDAELARWLTEEVPAAIVGRTELPPRPARPWAPRRSRWRLVF